MFLSTSFKAFDVINHSLLLKKLELYNFSTDALALLNSYLSNRQQKVLLRSKEFSLLPNNYGVPQGSVLGPLLFSLYINDLPLHIDAETELFADDTTIDKSDKTIEQVVTTLQNNMNNLDNWTKLNDMAIHPIKTKFMIVTTRQKRQNLLNTPPLYLANSLIEEVATHKVLGLIIDNSLSLPKLSDLYLVV